MPELEPLPAALGALNLRPLFTLAASVDAVHAPGGPAGAERRIGDVGGGAFRGERLAGTILDGGTDWQTLRADGAVLLDARIILKTDDDALIAMSYGGIRHASPDIAARIARGDAVDPADYYFRITATFSTSAPRYEWMNRIIAVGTGHRLIDGPVYNIFEII